MKHEWAIDEAKLKEIKNLFWLIHCDEVRDDPIGQSATYDVLKALETYRKYAMVEL